MTATESQATQGSQVATGEGRTAAAQVALACGILAVLAAFLMFWMIVVSVGFGVVAIVVGVRAHRAATTSLTRDMAVAAMTLGLVGILGTGGSIMVNAGGEDWGRHCAQNPTAEHC